MPLQFKGEWSKHMEPSPIGWYYFRCHRCCGIILSKDPEPIEWHKQKRCRLNENMLIYITQEALDNLDGS